MRDVRSLLLALTTALWVATGTRAEPLLIQVDAGNPPFMYSVGGTETSAGIYSSVLYAAFLRLGLPVVVKAVPWKRALLELDRGAAGVGGIYKNAERAAKYDYSDPIFVERIAVFYNTTRPMEFRSIRDLYGKRIGVIRGWSYGDDLDLARKYEEVIVEEASGDQQNFRKLAYGRLDAVLAIVEAGERVLEEGGGDLAYITMARTLLASNPAHLAFSKAADQQETLKLFNRELAAMKRDGSFSKIFQQELTR